MDKTKLRNKLEDFSEDVEDWTEGKVEEAKKSPKRAIVYGGFVVLGIIIVLGVLKGCFS
jgi:hypothetical protein